MVLGKTRCLAKSDRAFRATKGAQRQSLSLLLQTLMVFASLQCYLRNFHQTANCGILGFTSPLLYIVLCL